MAAAGSDPGEGAGGEKRFAGMSVIDLSDPAAMEKLPAQGKVEVVSASGAGAAGTAAATPSASGDSSAVAASASSGKEEAGGAAGGPDAGSGADDEPAPEVVRPGDVVSLEDAAKHGKLDYVGTMGKKVSVIEGLEAVPGIDYLCLRSNLIDRMQGMEHLTKLTHLELYENRVRSILSVATAAMVSAIRSATPSGEKSGASHLCTAPAPRSHQPPRRFADWKASPRWCPS